MTKVFLVILFLTLAGSASALVYIDTPEAKGGFQALMNPGLNFEIDARGGRDPSLYGVAPQHGMREKREFKNHTELLAFFRTFPESVQRQGLWIARAASSLWTAADESRLTELATAARSSKIRLVVCEPQLKERTVHWKCEQVSP
jgi:hypothetical protein